MFEHLDVNRFALVLDNEEIGYRYMICFNNKRYVWDMDKSIIGTLEKGLKNNGVVIKTGRPINGFMVGDVFKTKMEWGVTEIESVDALKKALKRMTSEYQDYIQLYDKIDVYFARLKTKLREFGAGGWLEARDEYERLTWECRFLGGFGAWRGSEEDICDADILDRNVSKLVDNAVKEVRKTLDSKHDLHWVTSEKAWCYFEFSVKSER